jgi:hypothetical protein
MATLVESAPAGRAGTALTRALLACGVGYAAVYIFANDVVAASLFEGYSRLDQAVSELSGTSAPSKRFLQRMLPVFTTLMLAFGLGVWRAAKANRALRLTGGLILLSGVVGVTWLFFPMTTREEMQPGTMATNDLGHLALSALSVTLILAQMAFSAAALGRGFRVFTAACAASLLGFGVLMSSGAAQVATGPTPLMGLFERLMLGGWFTWMTGLAVVLMRRHSGANRQDNRLHRGG